MRVPVIWEDRNAYLRVGWWNQKESALKLNVGLVAEPPGGVLSARCTRPPGRPLCAGTEAARRGP